jgi:hypothetical protein
VASVGRPRKLRFLVGVVALAVGLGALGIVAFSGGSSVGIVAGGPLACSDCHTGASMPADIGDVGTYGAADLQNQSDEPAILDHVEFVDLTPGLRILGPLVSRAGDRPSGGIGLIREFPPRSLKGALHPLHGYRVLPYHSFADDVQILVGVSPQRRGKLSYRRLKLFYRVGIKRYVATFDMGVRVCAPSSVPSTRCPTPLDDQ